MRETHDVASGAVRMVMALGRRVGEEDPGDLRYLDSLDSALAAARALAVDGLRRGGATDVQIGEALGMTRQAVQQRWPRTVRVVGAGARWQPR